MATKKEIFMSALRGEILERPAVACVDQTATYEQMELCGAKWPEANYDAEKLAELAFFGAKMLDWDAVRIPFCQTVEEEALGCILKPADEKNLPSVAEHAFKPKETPNPEFPADFLQRGRCQMLINAIKLAKEKILAEKAETGEERALMGGIIGPFTIASELIGLKTCLKFVLKTPEKLVPFLNIAREACVALGNELLKAGADAISCEDMMASVDIISPQNYMDNALPWEIEMCQQINGPVILHICGKVDFIIEGMMKSGAVALSFEPKTDVEAVKKALADNGLKLGLIGGIDTINDLFHGGVEEVAAAAKKAIADGYHVIAPGCSLPPATTADKLKPMKDAVDAYGK
ncbi:MAG: MtaA/CmuA family methyltransferase [Clostridia bacterium]|nr:MtaA/CmuA family methyltransferase [Clostridia bacterium]